MASGNPVLNESAENAPGVAVQETTAPQRAEAEETSSRLPPKPRHAYGYLAGLLNPELRKIAKEMGVVGFSSLRKDDLVIAILKAQAEELNYRFGGGTLEVLQEGYGFLRPKGLLPSDNDVYVSASQVRRFGLRNGDVIWGLVRPPRDSEHYEALLRVEMVNFSDPEAARRRPHFSSITPIFPDKKITLETDMKEISTRLVDLFAPIGMGQRALLVSPPKAGKTTLLKKIANAVTTNYPDIIVMVLLIDERPEEVTDMSRSVDGEIIASTFDRPSDEHLRVANRHSALASVRGQDVALARPITSARRMRRIPWSGSSVGPVAAGPGRARFCAFRGANIERAAVDDNRTAPVHTAADDEVIYESSGTGNMEFLSRNTRNIFTGRST